MGEAKIPVEATALSWSDGQLFDYLHDRFGNGQQPRSMAESALKNDYEDRKRKDRRYED